jgi:hypothetical protein
MKKAKEELEKVVGLNSNFKTSSLCVPKWCVGVAYRNQKVLVVNTVLGDESPVLEFTHKEWNRFLYSAKRGEFDIPSDEI